VHDDDLKRVAGKNISVEGSNFDELRAVRMKDLDGKTKRADLFLPAPEEYFSICKKYGKQSILELKNEFPSEKIEELVELIKKMKWFDGVTFISFSWENLVRLREKYPTASAQFLTETGSDKEIDRMIEYKIDADFCGYCITPEKVEKLHAAGRIFNCWTVDKLSDAELVKKAGVDMITTNILE
jgi:glycerophosphoryl diester phosphodiesterase